MNEIINLGNGAKVKVMMLKGEAGTDIESIEKTSTVGLVDTYTITLTDGSTQTFEVTNGRAIESIEKTSTVGLVDTYTITFNDGTSMDIEFEKADVQIDTELSTTSTNPVENRVITQALQAIADTIYPIGSIYMSVNTVNPSTLFGGTWERIKDKFLLSAGDTYSNGDTGGEETHTLLESEIPSHIHGLNNHTHDIPALSGKTNKTGAHTHKTDWPTWEKTAWYQENGRFCYAGSWTQTGGCSSAGDHEHTVSTNASTTGGSLGATDATGGAGTHNNMPPYLAVNVWKRTA